MKNTLIETVETSLGCLVFIGSSAIKGTYVLRIRVTKRLRLRFGRFKGGKLITVEPGEYAYVGSALGDKGNSGSLALRLIRHVTRTGRRLPHAIRSVMLSEFERVGLGAGNLLPRNGKTLRWNIDHSLDHASVEVIGVFVIRSAKRIEGDVGKLLENDPATAIVERGLGANDIKGNTHFLRVNAPEQWWKTLPQRLVTVLDRHKSLEVIPTKRQRTKLKNMHRHRRCAIQLRMAGGISYSAAEKASQGVFDTVGWHEVVSRLRRARGIVSGIQQCLVDGRLIVSSLENSAEFRTLLRETATDAGELTGKVGRADGKLPPGFWRRQECPTRPYGRMKRMTGSFAIGQLRAARKFVVKCCRDAPRIEDFGGAKLTVTERTTIMHEIAKLRRSARYALRAISNMRARLGRTAA